MIYNKKSQINIIDMIIAIAIALILIVAIIVSWDRFVLKIAQKTSQNDMEIIAFQISDMLISNPGNPENWNTKDLSNPSNYPDSLGLALADRVVSEDKLIKIDSLSCSALQDLLNINDLKYFQIQLCQPGLNGIVEHVKICPDGAPIPDYDVKIKRTVIYQQLGGGYEIRNVKILVSK